MTGPISPLQAALLRGATAVEHPGDTPAPFTVPISLLAVPVCDECGSSARPDFPDGPDVLDLLHAPDCYLGELERTQADIDIAGLNRLAPTSGEHRPLRVDRRAVEAEVALWASVGKDATDTPVVITPTIGGGRKRAFPYLADDLA